MSPKDIKSSFDVSAMHPSTDITYEIKRRVREDEDNFIFETIEPYCSNIAQQKMSKKDLEEAIQLWMAAKRIMHKEESDENNGSYKEW